MTNISIFGTGAMGSAIGDLLAGKGATVQNITKADDAIISGDIVVLAVPYEELSGIVFDYRDQLVGKIVVDISNPLDFDTFDSLKVANDSSAAADCRSACRTRR